MKNEIEENFNLFQLIIVVLSIYVLVALIISSVFDLSPELHQLLDYIDNAICIVFISNFFLRLYEAENKLKFLKWGWIDLVSSIPNIELFRYGRILRLIRLLRILRAFRSTKVLVKYIFRKKAHGAFTTASIFAILILIFSSIAILQVETTDQGNIKTAEDALWWAFTTITTVGYGDKFPVTTEGRLIGVILMTAGVGLFGVFTGFVASWFVEDHQKENSENISENKSTQ